MKIQVETHNAEAGYKELGMKSIRKLGSEKFLENENSKGCESFSNSKISYWIRELLR
jgi:hypothetical protein